MVTPIPFGDGWEMFGTFYEMLADNGKAGAIKFVLNCFLESTYGGQTCAPNIGQCAIARRACARLEPDRLITYPDLTDCSYR